MSYAQNWGGGGTLAPFTSKHPLIEFVIYWTKVQSAIIRFFCPVVVSVIIVKETDMTPFAPQTWSKIIFGSKCLDKPKSVKFYITFNYSTSYPEQRFLRSLRTIYTQKDLS